MNFLALISEVAAIIVVVHSVITRCNGS